ncbi:FkbM family methyltransferase [Planctomycetota bacterium]
MHQVKRLLKRSVWKILPYSTVQIIKKRHYLRLLRSPLLEQEPELRVVRYLVKSGDSVIDIGANIGVYSKILSELVGPDGHVYSIEPFPPTFEILCYNVKKLRLDNVEPINVAVSDSQAVVTMVLPYDPSGAETHYRASIVKDCADTRKEITNVQAITIDSRFLSASGTISFIKCDVEGHELACIKGAVKFLAQSKPAWLIEVSGEPDDTDSVAHSVFKILCNQGYFVWWYDGSKLRKRHPGDKSTNYFFLKDNHIDILKNSELKVVST